MMLSRWRVFAAKLGGFFGRRKAELDFDDQMRVHLQLLTEQGIRRGMSPEEARSAARRQFGNISLLQQSRREMRSIVSLANLGRDPRFSARQLGRSPSLAIAGSLWLSRSPSAMLYGLKPSDRVTLTGAAVLLLRFALPAAFGPARRASRGYPVRALRHQ